MIRYRTLAVAGLAWTTFACSADEGTGLDMGVGPGDSGASADARLGGDGGDVPRYTWWQDVEPIVAVKCQLCHTNPPLFGAPRPFVDYQDTQVELQPNVPVHEAMAFRITAEQKRMPGASQPQLTTEEIEIIQSWSAIGAPEGTRPVDPQDSGRPDSNETNDAGKPGDVGEPGDAGEPTDAGDTDAGTGDAGQGPPRMISRTLNIVAKAPTSNMPYELPVSQTNYTCWAFTIPAGVPDEHAFRFEPIVDNTVNTHHTLLFVNNNNDETDGVPFDCEGFPLTWNLVAGWAPGRMADEIPAGAGVPMAAGTQVILQVHYDRVMTTGVTDASGFRVVLTDEPNLIPAGMLWSGVIWNSSINGSNVQKQGTCTLRQDLTMFSVFPHMHQVGKTITMEIQRQGTGPWTRLVDIQGWSFEDQPNVPIPAPEQLMRSGDKIRTTCWWDTQGQSVNFGEASDDEMCFNFIYHYPQINFQFACVSYQP